MDKPKSYSKFFKNRAMELLIVLGAVRLGTKPDSSCTDILFRYHDMACKHVPAKRQKRDSVFINQAIQR